MDAPTPQEINDWLARSGRTREWLAEQTGAAKTSIDGWLSRNRPKPILAPTLKLIERLMCDDLLGEPQYSLKEAKLIRHAMAQEGYVSLRDFIKDAVAAHARNLNGIWRKNVAVGFEKSAYYLNLAGAVAHHDPLPADFKKGPVPVFQPYPSDHYALQLAGRIPGRAEDGSILVVKPRPFSTLPAGTLVVCRVKRQLELWELAADLLDGEDDSSAIIRDKFSAPRALEGRIEAVVVEVI